MTTTDTVCVFYDAFHTRDIEAFTRLLFPPAWGAITARIVESGAEMSPEMCPWAPRWSLIPPTVRKGATALETWVKSCLFRAHDCFHQLWGLPIPDPSYSEDAFYSYKRAQMCGEVAVLTLTEFVLAPHLYDTYAELREVLWKRNAIPLLREGPLQGKSTVQVALRLDDILHKKRRPRWVRDSREASAFADDYVPMLEADRRDIDHNWALMKKQEWRPSGAPNARYSQDLDGLELTAWMIDDFYHLVGTDSVVDEALRDFNRERRRKIVLPAGWGLSAAPEPDPMPADVRMAWDLEADRLFGG